MKNESFSIGVTLLSMALLQNVSSIYRRKEDEINEKQLEEYLKKLREVNYFSSVLKSPTQYSDSFCYGI